MYSPDLDDAVIPLEFITTFILDINKTKPREQKLEHMSSQDKIKQIWKLLNQENELKNILNCENLWERPSLRYHYNKNNIYILLLLIMKKKLGRSRETEKDRKHEVWQKSPS